jgi:hypothetical protein
MEDFAEDGVPRAWRVQVYPTVYVLDHEGRIRHEGLHGKALEEAVAALIAEAKAAPQPMTAAMPLVPMRPVNADAADEPPADGAELDAFEALEAEFEAASDAWYDRLRELRGKEGYDEVRKARPAYDFYPRFEALSAEGEGRATLWTLHHVNFSGRTADEQIELRARLFFELAESHADAEWIGGIGSTLGMLHGTPHFERAELAARELMANAADEDARRSLTYNLARALSGRKATPAELERAKACYRSVAEQWPDSREGERAPGLVFRLERLQVGMRVPELTGKALDGSELRLSDTLGKVTVIDFWGFW